MNSFVAQHSIPWNMVKYGRQSTFHMEWIVYILFMPRNNALKNDQELIFAKPGEWRIEKFRTTRSESWKKLEWLNSIEWKWDFEAEKIHGPGTLHSRAFASLG